MNTTSTPTLEKAATHIRGLDEITLGGLPRGRPTLVCGGAGCGKSLLGVEFLSRAAKLDGEPGVLFTFEERAEDVLANTESLGLDLNQLIADDLLRIEAIHLDASEIAETGEFDLEGLFIRIESAVREIGATRIVLDTLEVMFSAFSNHGILRSELGRLFRWLKSQSLTAVITAERGQETLTRFGLEEYVSDCVLVLNHTVLDEISTRRLRVLKYRGSAHGTNEYPFVIDRTGFSIFPITSSGEEIVASTEYVSSGTAGLDALLDGRGFYRGSTVLVSGTPGTGKSTLGIAAAVATAQAGERALLFAFEESPSQIKRNMSSIGFDLQPLMDADLLRIDSSRPALLGLEQHLLHILREAQEWQPSLIVLDPISGFLGARTSVSQLLNRLTDALKLSGITCYMTYLDHGPGVSETTSEGISSLADSWILLNLMDNGAGRDRTIHVLKSRGQNHSSQVCGFNISANGLRVDPLKFAAKE